MVMMNVEIGSLAKLKQKYFQDKRQKPKMWLDEVLGIYYKSHSSNLFLDNAARGLTGRQNTSSSF